MKVLCIYGSCGPFFVRGGLGNAFSYAGHSFQWWKKDEHSAFDIFDSVQPDLFIGTTWELDRATIKCIKERPDMKVAMVASNWGEFDSQIDLKKHPILVANEKELKLVEQLKEETGKPDVAWCHYSDEWMTRTHNFWSDKLGIQITGVLNAADIIDYYPGTYSEKLASDISFVGGYWGYKARTLDKTIVELCYPIGRYRIKIWGNQKWPVPQYMGVVETATYRDIVSSTKILPNVSEEHSNVYGFDLVERPFKIGSMGGFCFSDKADWKDILPSMPVYEKANDLPKLIDYYLKNDDDRDSLAKKLQEEVLESHTYFDRAAKVLDRVGLKNESQSLMKAKTQCIQQRYS